MADAFTVESKLTFQTNALSMVADLIKQFDRLDIVIASTQKGLSQLAADLRALNGGGRGLANAAKSLEALSKARVAPELLKGLREAETATSGLVTMQRDMAKLSSETAANYRSMAQAGGRASRAQQSGPGGPSRGGNAGHGSGWSNHDTLNVGIGLQAAGGAGMGIFEKSFMAETEVLSQLASLRMNTTLNDGDIAKARAAAEAATRNTPGSTLAENLHHLVDAFTVMGNLNEAMSGLPALSQAAYVLKNMPGAHHGDSSFAAMQAIEVMQRFYDPKTGHTDMAAFNQQVAAMQQVALGTGGRVDGNAYLGFAKQSRVGGMVANDQYLYRDLPAMLIAQGGNRVGTGDAAVWNQFVTGKMTKDAFAQLQKTGLIDGTAKWHGGRVTDMMKHLRNPELFGANRVEWIRQEILGDSGALARQKINPHDRLAVANFLSQWASRQTGLGFLSEGALGMEGIDKEAAKIGQTTKNPLGVMEQYDPMQKIREFRAAENQLYVTLGQAAMGPGLEALKKLTELIQYLDATAKAHPDAAKNMMMIGGGLSAVASAAGEAALVIFLGAPLIKGLGALSAAALPFGAGGEAGAALATLSGVGVGSLAALGVAAVGLVVAINEGAKAMGWVNTAGAGHGGKGLQPPGFSSGPAAPGSSTNEFEDALKRWWNAPGPQGPVRGGASRGGNQLRQRSSYTPDAGVGADTPVQMTGVINLDGRQLGTFVGNSLAREMSGPSGGTTAFDARTVFSGSMIGAAP